MPFGLIEDLMGQINLGLSTFNLRGRIEAGFETFTGIIYQHRIKTLLIMAIFIGSMIVLVAGYPSFLTAAIPRMI